MAPKPSLRALGGLIPLIFSILAFTFSILAVTSPDWAKRDQYPDNTDAVSQSDVIFTRYRSPYEICTAELIEDPNSNNNDEEDEDDGGPPPVPTAADFRQVCTRFPIRGDGKTSCETPSTLGTNLALQVGDARQCQQINLAGEYHVASAVFLGMSLVISVFAAVASFVPLAPLASKGDSTFSGYHGRSSAVVPSLVQILSVPALVGAATALLAQYYGVLGLIQSAPNNGDFVISQGNREHHDPWVQGKALGLYLGFSWFWSLLAAWSAWLVWGRRSGHGGHRNGAVKNSAAGRDTVERGD